MLIPCSTLFDNWLGSAMVYGLALTYWCFAYGTPASVTIWVTASTRDV